jgi:tetratricopeptide (TPR) repeat protein
LRAAGWLRRGLLAGGLLALALLWYARVYIPFAQSQFWLLQARLSNDTAYVEQAMQAMPDNYLPYAALGDMRRAQGDLPGALAAYEQAAALAPQNSYVHANRLDLYRHMGDDAGARAAMDAIAAVGWDNNTLYAWAWEQLPAATGAQLDVAAPAPGLLRGVYAPEFAEGYTLRWTKEHTQVRFSAQEADRLLLLLRADVPTPVQVWYQGVRVASLQVGTRWATFAVLLPPENREPRTENRELRTENLEPGAGSQGSIVVELRAPTHVISTAEPYPRGVALGGAWLVADEQ